MGQEYGLKGNMIEEERGCLIMRSEICAGHLLGHLNLLLIYLLLLIIIIKGGRGGAGGWGGT